MTGQHEPPRPAERAAAATCAPRGSLTISPQTRSRRSYAG